MQFITNIRQKMIGRKSATWVVAFIVIVLLIVVIGIKQNSEISEEELVKKPQVTVTTPFEFSTEQSVSLLGNVRALSEARITSERSGRVVAVNVRLGQTVTPGQIIATLENASERASVLQAEGVYDSALALSAQNEVGVTQAETSLVNVQNGAVSTLKSTYNIANGIVLSDIDAFFTDPNSRVPGLRIDGRGFTEELNSRRVSLQTSLPSWQNRVNEVSQDSNLEAEIQYSKENVQKIIEIIDTFLIVFDKQDNSTRYTEAELILFQSNFTSLRSTLIGLQTNLDGALTTLQSADESLKRAKLQASGGANSASDAQVKQALGSLRSAEANLAKTILRTPVSGTINSLSVKTGDFLNSFSEVAIVANNSALEIVTYVGDSERNLIDIGDIVMIEGEFEGLVTEIAPAVDVSTGKTEVRIATEGTDIRNGDTVRITKKVSDSDASLDQMVRIPLTAIKFEREDGSVFQIVDGKLEKRPVELGVILGNSVEVVSGLKATDEFVVDVRGLVAGESVEIAK